MNIEEIKNEIIKIAQLSAENFSYYKSKNPNAGNIYIGMNEIEGQCSDYALWFVIHWNKAHPENQAEIVAVNQEKGIKSGSYEIVKKTTDQELSDLGIKYFKRNISSWLRLPQTKNEEECSFLFHPKIGIYQLN
jgi:hypothetical protein